MITQIFFLMFILKNGEDGSMFDSHIFLSGTLTTWEKSQQRSCQLLKNVFVIFRDWIHDNLPTSLGPQKPMEKLGYNSPKNEGCGFQ